MHNYMFMYIIIGELNTPVILSDTAPADELAQLQEKIQEKDVVCSNMHMYNYNNIFTLKCYCRVTMSRGRLSRRRLFSDKLKWSNRK